MQEKRQEEPLLPHKMAYDEDTDVLDRPLEEEEDEQEREPPPSIVGGPVPGGAIPASITGLPPVAAPSTSENLPITPRRPSISGMPPLSAKPPASVTGLPPMVNPTPPDTLAGPIAGAAPSGPNLPADVLSGRVAEPQWKDYKPAHVGLGRQILARSIAGLQGLNDPRGARETRQSIMYGPQLENYRGDLGEFKGALDQGERAQKQAGVEQQRSLTGERIKTEEATQGLRGAQTDLEKQKLADLKNAPEKPEDKKIDEGFNAQNQRVHIYQKPDGTTYTKVFPDIVQQKTAGEGAQPKADILAQIGEEPKAGEKNSKGYTREEWGQRAEKLEAQNADEAARIRTEGYIEARMKAPVQMLDTQNGNRPVTITMEQNMNEPGRYMPATEGAKALVNEATYQDIKKALTNLKATTKVLNAGGMNRAAIAAVLANPQMTAAQFLQSEPAASLSKEERGYVVALLNAREVVPGIRGMLGVGNATDARVALMLNSLPGAKTPDSDFANQQIDASLQTLERAHRSVPQVNLPKESGGGGAAGGIDFTPLPQH